MTPLGPERSTGHPPLQAGDSVARLVGIGPKTAAALEAVGVRRVADLLFHLPRRYEDRGRVISVEEATRELGSVLVYGRLTVHSGRWARRRLHITDGELADDTGCIRVRWFNQPWITGRLEGGVEAFVYGAVGRDTSKRPQVLNPEIEIVPRSSRVEEIAPIYSGLGPLGGKRLRKIIDQALGCLEDLADPLPDTVRREFALMPLAESLGDLHRPALPGDPGQRREWVAALNRSATAAHHRLAFDELLAVASVVAGYRARRLEQAATPVRIGPEFDQRCRALFPFELTAAQRRVIAEIVDDLRRPSPMARLLQGDVGSGKTAVAITAIFAILADGRQATLMAPTELLAEQLHRSAAGALEPLGFRVRLLTGSLPRVEAGAVRAGVAGGEIDVVVGTHALFQEGVPLPTSGWSSSTNSTDSEWRSASGFSTRGIHRISW